MDPSTLYLWKRRTLYVGGEQFSLREINSAASILLVALDQDLEVRIDQSPDSCVSRSVLVPAGTAASGEAKGRVACLFLDPFLDQDLHPLQRLMTQQIGPVFYDSCIESQQVQAFQCILQEQLDPGSAYRLLCDRVLPVCGQIPSRPSVDQRVAKVIDMLKAEHGINVSNKVLAERVGVSSSQLQRLFKVATGIPIRRYRLWHRLFEASVLIGLGRSLTDAAVEAGFSDSSHFTHTYYSMLGLKPSAIMRGKSRTRILVGGD